MKAYWLFVSAIGSCLLLSGCGFENSRSEITHADSGISKTEELENNSDVSEASSGEGLNSEKDRLKEQYTAVSREFEQAMQDFREAYYAAEETDRRKIYAEKYPNPTDYAGEMLEIARSNPESETAVDALFWVVRSGEQADTAIDLLLRDHFENERIRDVCGFLAAGQPSSETEEVLKRIMEESPHDTVRAGATISLARYVSRLEAARDYVTENPDDDRFDDVTTEYLSERKIDSAEIENLYQKVIDDYGDLTMSDNATKYRERAESALFKIRHLAIGKVAPDIEGEDLDGESFKLSEYRGKVVLLDFWGDW